jgi:hypothetical protein
MNHFEGTFILRGTSEKAYDCHVYKLRGFVWSHVASFVQLGDAEQMFPNAQFFEGHSSDCDCIGPSDKDCLACSEAS